jgi:hypothetical protein
VLEITADMLVPITSGIRPFSPLVPGLGALLEQHGHGFYNALQLRSSLGCLSPNENARKIKLSDTTTFLRFLAQGALQLGGRPATLSDVFALIDADLGRNDDFASAQVRR